MPVGHRTPRGRELGRAGTRGVMLVTVRVSTITSFDDEGGEGIPAQGSAWARAWACRHSWSDASDRQGEHDHLL